MDGFINLLKPAGMTSHDAVFALRRILRMKKIGHTGTLDPMASGVLVMCLGNGTRAAEYLEADEKSYRCELVLGITTDTGDVWGSPEGGDKEAALKVTMEQVREVLKSVEGVQQQYPPMYSAVRKNGRRLYDYARNGETVEVEPRTVNIYDVEPVHIFHEPARVIFDVTCSKGTYIRTICTEIGEKLGCGAAMSCLVRTRNGNFYLKDAVTVEEMLHYVSIQENIDENVIMTQRIDEPLKADMSSFIKPLDQMSSGFGSVSLNETECQKYVNGGRVAMRNSRIIRKNSIGADKKFNDIYLVYGPEGEFRGTATYDKKKKIFTVGKVFFR